MNSGKDSSSKWLIVSAVFIALSIIFLLIPERKPEPPPDGKKVSPPADIVVAEIIDGDTFRLSDGSTVRLIGVDTPEKNQPLYEEAVDFAESLFSGRSARLEQDKDTVDKYGRDLFYVFIDSEFVNEAILRQGLGSVYLFQSNLRYARRLIDAQKKARAKNVGIWSLPEPPPEEYYIRVAGSYRFHRPLCMTIKNSDPNRWIKCSSRDSLLDAGISPCRSCGP